VLDDALLGWLRGELQVLRNALFAASKVAALVAVGLASLPRDGLLIYTSWAVGILVSLVGLAGLDAWKGRALHAYRPRWQLVRQLRRAAMLHHLVNLALQAPPMALPLLVTTVLSTTSTAYFYPAWMVASFAFVGPIALATAFYPVGAAAPDALALRLRFSLLIALLVGLATYLALLVGAELLLSPFGRIYAAEGAPCLQLLGLGIFPLIVKEHYVVIRRLHGRLLGGAAMLAAGGLLELVLAALGATLGGLTGLSLGWVLAVCVEAVVMAPTVYRATNLQPGRHAESPGTV
ncbi:MAG: hypothetical protein JO023_29520, partial [Chloroflexi bacterium]|nr:hypothetical protein [Chloroflexota bacterium]